MSEERKVEPVLSRKEWGYVEKYEADYFVARAGPMAWMDPKEVGAIALHGYFTWDMVDRIRWAADLIDGTSISTAYSRERTAELRADADAMAALLPPRDMETDDE